MVGHMEIGDRYILGAQTGVTKNLPSDSGTWLLSPAAPLREAKEQIAWIHRLGKLLARVKAIEKKLGLGERGRSSGELLEKEAVRRPWQA